MTSEFDHLPSLQPPASSEAHSDTTPRWLASFERKPLVWLWEGRLLCGKLNVISGDPGVGKTAVLCDIAARVTAGREMPWDRRGTAVRGRVLILTAEDDPGDTLRPLIEAAGGDVGQVIVLEDAPLRFPVDADKLRTLIVEHDVVLVIIDPITSHYERGIDLIKDTDVRRALKPLKAIAAETGAAFVLVRHLRKAGGSAIHAGAGSMALTAMVRSELLCGKDPTTKKLTLASVKLNVGESGRAPVS